MAESAFSGHNQQTPNEAETVTGTYRPSGQASTVPHLLRQLLDDASVLIRKEIALASSEITHAVDQAKQGAVGLVSGSAVLYAGVLFLLAAATLGLAEVVPGWAAALIVGGVVSLIGLIMLQTGKKKVQPRNFAPHRTGEALRKDRDMIERQTS